MANKRSKKKKKKKQVLVLKKPLLQVHSAHEFSENSKTNSDDINDFLYLPNNNANASACSS